MKSVTIHKQITTGTTGTPATTVFINGSAYVSQIVFCCTNSGTGWTMKVQDRGTPIASLVTVALSATATPDQEKVFFDEPVIMVDGVDVVTAGTGAGKVDVWITANKTEEGA